MSKENKPKSAELSEEALEHVSGGAFSSAVEREMKESGEKGGTEDINIGVGELQEGAIPKKKLRSH